MSHNADHTTTLQLNVFLTVIRQLLVTNKGRSSFRSKPLPGSTEISSVARCTFLIFKCKTVRTRRYFKASAFISQCYNIITQKNRSSATPLRKTQILQRKFCDFHLRELSYFWVVSSRNLIDVCLCMRKILTFYVPCKWRHVCSL